MNFILNLKTVAIILLGITLISCKPSNSESNVLTDPYDVSEKLKIGFEPDDDYAMTDLALDTAVVNRDNVGFSSKDTFLLKDQGLHSFSTSDGFATATIWVSAFASKEKYHDCDRCKEKFPKIGTYACNCGTRERVANQKLIATFSHDGGTETKELDFSFGNSLGTFETPHEIKIGTFNTNSSLNNLRVNLKTEGPTDAHIFIFRAKIDYGYFN